MSTNMSWKIPLILFVVSCKMKYITMVSHNSNLCEARNMTCGDGKLNSCVMKYYLLNSTECRDLTFNDVSTVSDDSLGKVLIETYYYTLHTWRQTAFNLSFHDIHWKQVKFRYKQDGFDLKNTCREFILAQNATVKDLFYDCIWSTEAYEGKAFFLEYELNNGTHSAYQKYAFKVPNARFIDYKNTNATDWELFTYASVFTNGFGITTFDIYWQPMPKKFKIDSYNVTVITYDSGVSKIIGSEKVSCTADSHESCRFTSNQWYGNVQFGIQPICNYSVPCTVAKTQIFLLGGEHTKPVLICIVSITLTVPVLFYLIFLLRNFIIYKSRLWIRSIPKLLIIYSPSLPSHVEVVFALARYLKNYCYVEPLVDEWEIPNSKSKDPFKWCNESFKQADYVMVVTSPYHKNLRLSNSVYKNIDVLLLRLLCERLTTRGSKTQFFSLSLTYASETDLPAEAVNLRRFSFPADLDRMLGFMHREWKLPGCLSAGIRGGKEDFALCGKELAFMIEQAQADLRKNKSEYQSLVEEQRRDAIAPPEQDGMTCLEHHETDCCHFDSHTLGNKTALMALAKETFEEFPGSLDSLALCGEYETQRLVSSGKPSGILDLDSLVL